MAGGRPIRLRFFEDPDPVQHSDVFPSFQPERLGTGRKQEERRLSIADPSVASMGRAFRRLGGELNSCRAGSTRLFFVSVNSRFQSEVVSRFA